MSGGSSAVLDSRLASLAAVLDAVRSADAHTRPEIERSTGLGRKVVAQRVSELLEAGLLDEGTLGPSTGGRAPRLLRFTAESGVMLVAHFGATGVVAGVADLSGTMLTHRRRPHNIADGPDAALDVMVEMWDALLAQLDAPGIRARVWGVGVGVPGPVEFSTARPMSPPIMPGWDEFPIRERIQETWATPVWVDNDVNTMALGELRGGLARGSADLVYIKIGTGIGAGIVSRGRLHRGAQGVAGDIGHIPVREVLGVVCRCGRVDCLEAVAGGRALVDAATVAAHREPESVLADLLRRDHALTLAHLSEAASYGDRATIDLLRTAGRRIGEGVASLVNTLNPDLVVLGGPVSEVSELILATVRHTVYERSLPLATRDLVLTRSVDSDLVGITGAAFMVIDEIFRAEALEHWVEHGRPGADISLLAPSS
ncbi:ROK family protein [Demequina soli]|uniref:ROK family protein n=1 Tax=Demequina soli TaxID=1638987 RepID=UPI000781B590|nr:ROK family protein [Demequina soli]